MTTGVSEHARMPALDGIRGIAIVLVVASHALPGPYVLAGPAGVAVFFTLSGYLIGSLLLAEADRGPLDVVGFYLRRARRLLPALVAVLAVLVAAGVLTFAAALPSLLYVQNFWPLEGPFPVTWSLSIEEQFYLTFPWTLLLLRRRLSHGQLAAVYGGAAAASLGARVTLALAGVDAYTWTLTNAGLLLTGVTLALVVRMTPRRLPGTLTAPLIASLAALGLVGDTDLARALVPILAAGLTAALILAGRSSGLLNDRRLGLVGRRSYGLYLWHYPILVLAGTARGPEWLMLSIGVAVAWGVTLLSWRYVEEPFLRRRVSSTTLALSPARAG